MSTRKRRGFFNSSDPTKSDLPPSRKGKATAQPKTNPPFSGLRFDTFIYILSGLALLFIAFNVWRLLQLKTGAGGWWPLLFGKSNLDIGGAGSSRGHSTGKSRGGDGGNDGVEDLITTLAEALGLPSHELASAVAEAVKNHAPSQSLSVFETLHTGTAIEDEGMPAMGAREGLKTFAGFDDPVMD